jgi:hydrogenase maturation protease
MRVLVYAIGNSSRQDDGAGAACAERLAEWCRSEGRRGVTVLTRLQLDVDDAAEMAGADLVLFLDASVAEIDGVLLERLTGTEDVSFSPHLLSPNAVLGVCRSLYGKSPEAFALHIRGAKFEVGERMTIQVERNIEAALQTAQELLKRTIL